MRRNPEPPIKYCKCGQECLKRKGRSAYYETCGAAPCVAASKREKVAGIPKPLSPRNKIAIDGARKLAQIAEGKPGKPEPYVRKEIPEPTRLELDAQQSEHDRTVQSKIDATFPLLPARSVPKEEWASLKITPIADIRSGVLQEYKTSID